MSIQADTLSQDYRSCSGESEIIVETMFGFTPDGIHFEYIGSLVGELVYDSQEEAFVLNKDSVRIEWMENQ